MNRKRLLWSFPFTCLMLAAILMGLCPMGCGSTRGKDAKQSASAAGAAGNPKGHVPVFGAKVVKTYPHDPRAFTQGLEFYGRYLYESTGRAGQSTLRKVALETGEVLKKASLPPQYFGEGLTIFHGKIYQLTWLSKTGFVYDLASFRQIGEFHYESEGWGLTHDDNSLILSDGTNKIRFLDPVSFAVTKTIEVYSGDEAVANLNELEYIDGQIFSNVWHSSRIAGIDPHSGQVLAWIDLTPLVLKEQHGNEDVLNGIAYDREAHRMFVTGKDWPEIIEIKLDSKPQEQEIPEIVRELQWFAEGFLRLVMLVAVALVKPVGAFADHV